VLILLVIEKERPSGHRVHLENFSATTPMPRVQDSPYGHAGHMENRGTMGLLDTKEEHLFKSILTVLIVEDIMSESEIFGVE